MDARSAIDECVARVAPAGSDVYYATLHLGPTQREAVLSLLAFASELAAIPRITSDPGVAQLRLAWWQEELSRLQDGTPRHPIAIALAATGVPPTVPAETLRSLVDVAMRRFDARRCPDISATVAAHRCFEGESWRAIALLTGATGPAEDAAATLGTVIGIVGTLTSLRDHVLAGTARLPADALAARGIAIDEIAGAGTEVIRDVATLMADEAIRQADTVLSDPTPARSEGLLPHLIMTAIARNTLDELRADGFAVMQRRIALTPLRKLWIALMLRRRHRHRR